MFSNDHNVEIIARLITNLKRYGELRLKGMQLDLVSRLTMVLTLIVVGVVLVGVVSLVVLLLSFALVLALAPLVGGMIVACCLVAGGFVLLGILLVAFRKRLLINPIARLLSAIFLSEDYQKEDAEEAIDAQNGAYDKNFY